MNKPSTQKIPLTVYTVMLILATIFMLAACILMFVELYRYGGSPWDKATLPPRAMQTIESNLAWNQESSPQIS